jgi:hypothetical protein
MTGKAHINLAPQRQRGDLIAWRTSLKELESTVAASVPPVNSEAARTRDAAQRVAPLLVLTLSLCTIELLIPWGWPRLMAQVHLSGARLALGLTMTWLIGSVFLGCMLSLPLAPWIRARCQ